MEDIILKRYRRSTLLQIDTAKDIFKDFKQMFSDESLENITPARIRSKFQTMQKLRRDKPILAKTPSYDWPPESPKTSFKDSMFDVMRRSENMTITIKGTEITVVFK